MASNKPRQRVTLNGQSRKMVYDVFNFMAKEAAEGVKNVKQIQQRTAEATKISTVTVRRILKLAMDTDKPAFRTPGRIRKRNSKVTNLSDYEKGVMKRCIHSFHLANNELPTIFKLLTKMRTEINYKGSQTSLRRIIKSLGFKWKCTDNNKKVLLEDYNIRLQRLNYIHDINKYRQENRPIVYAGKTFLYEIQNTPEGIKKFPAKGKCAVIVHAGTEEEFLSNALLTFKSDINQSSEYPDGMTFDMYQLWLRKQLIPFLPPRSVLVIDNASYNNKKFDTAPGPNSKKSEMEAWLTEKGIPFSPNMYKPQLYKLIKSNSDCLKLYHVDKMLLENGHDVLHLPPQHSDLSPFQMLWNNITEHVTNNIEKWDLSNVIGLVREKIESMEPSVWQALCDEVKVIEQDYIKSDHIVDRFTDELVIKRGHESDSSSDSEESMSSSDDEDEEMLSDESSSTKSDNSPTMPCVEDPTYEFIALASAEYQE